MNLPWPLFALALPLAFLMGSVPFALLIGLANGVDIRTTGSKNVGATNLGRALGLRFFLLCFALDALKGLIPTLAFGLAAGFVGTRAFSLPPLAAALWLALVAAPVAGHMYSPWIGFKGGKGVATGLGALLGVFPALTLPGLGALVVFLGVFFAFRYVSLASILAAASLPLWVWYAFRLASTVLAQRPTLGDPLTPFPARPEVYLPVSAALALVVILKHRGNIRRLLAGTEPKARPAARGATSTPPRNFAHDGAHNRDTSSSD